MILLIMLVQVCGYKTELCWISYKFQKVPFWVATPWTWPFIYIDIHLLHTHLAILPGLTL